MFFYRLNIIIEKTNGTKKTHIFVYFFVEVDCWIGRVLLQCCSKNLLLVVVFSNSSNLESVLIMV